MRRGAFDYLPKPFRPTSSRRLDRMARMQRLQFQVDEPEEQVRSCAGG